MTHALNFSVAAELKEAFDKQLSDCSDRAIKVRIADESFTLASTLPWGDNDPSAALTACKALLSETEACFLLFRLERGLFGGTRRVLPLPGDRDVPR